MIANPQETLPKTTDGFPPDRSSLLSLLQKAQEEEGYLTREAVAEIARSLDLSPNEVYSVASFFAGFRFARPGAHTVAVCLCTACRMRGAGLILKTIERELGVQPGQTTPGGKYTLEAAPFCGCSPLAPVVTLDGDLHGRMTPAKAKELLVQTGACKAGC
ncbi:MAG: NAD(P)H-dependent oxidoreductase subunit E [Firmicutes bacterium]|nr:NAD(P)H-dependent oxidoreductase subunit E [Bacillota bacterium]